MIVSKLKMGRINFINCLPIDYPLSQINNEAYDFRDASPAELNKQLRKNEINIAPISSYEYLSHKDIYQLIPKVSISSRNQADSVLFFYRSELNNLKQIYLTNKSATSINLLKLVLIKKYGLNLDRIDFVGFDVNSTDYQAKLLIGDEALKEKKENYEKVLDLGSEWFEITQLPMVFGLWTANKNLGFSNEEVENLGCFLAEMRNKGLNELFPDIVIEAYKRTGLPKSLLTSYFNNLDYRFNNEHKNSLEYFEKLLAENNLLS